MKIPLVDLPRQNKLLKKKLFPVINSVYDNAEFIMGKHLRDFEKNFAHFCRKKYAVGLNSGTDGLKLALIAYGIGIGDEVITVPNSYFSTAMVITDVGAKPVFVDINPETHTIDVTKIEENITKKTKAIIPVHLYGQPADMDPVVRLAKKYKLVIIEDCCQAHGAEYKNKRVPYYETGAFSFYPGKNLGSFGDGGMLVTNNKKVAEILQFLRNDGSQKKYIHKQIGTKSRLDSFQAAILNAKLPNLPKWNKKRQRLADMYRKKLGKISEIHLPIIAKNVSHAYHLFVIEYQYRDQLQRYLQTKNIETGIHYPLPIHLQEPYKKQGFKKGEFPITEMKSKLILSLPIFPEMQEKEVSYVCAQIIKFVRSKKKI